MGSVNHEVTVCIPTHTGRERMLARALTSVLRQTKPADAISVALDSQGDGAGFTRNRAWRAAQTEWVAFLDSDDELLPQHLQRLCEHQAETGADFVYSWFECVGNTDPFPEDTHYLAPWDPADPRQTTITFMVRRQILEDLGGFREIGADAGTAPDGMRAGEDFELVCRINEVATISHLVERTWRWHHHGQNTSGLPERWHPSPRVGLPA